MFSLSDLRVFVPCVFLLMVQSGHGSEIIGGHEVKPPHSMHYMALLQNKTQVCGGILIDPKWVLTAAYCEGFNKVMLGVHNIKKKEKDRQVLKVKESYPHPSYDEKLKVNDIMLLELKKPAKQTKTVKCLKLGKSTKYPAAGTKCLVAGWGRTENKNKSDVLMSAHVTVIDRVKCNSPDYYNHKPAITKSMICAGSDGRNKADTCQGDSGGPLLCNGAVVGVTSFRKDCGLPKKPGVYSFLTEEHLTWIKKKMGGM